MDPKTGKEIRNIDFGVLREIEMVGEGSGYPKYNNVLNGIAYDGLEKVFYMTGKKWKYVFKVRIPDRPLNDEL